MTREEYAALTPAEVSRWQNMRGGVDGAPDNQTIARKLWEIEQGALLSAYTDEQFVAAIANLAFTQKQGQEFAGVTYGALVAYSNTLSGLEKEVAKARINAANNNFYANQARASGQRQGGMTMEERIAYGHAADMDIIAGQQEANAAADKRSFVAGLIKEPNRVKNLVEFVDSLKLAEVKLTLPDPRGSAALVIADENIIIPIPLKLSAPIADSTATAASVSTQLNLLLAALRSTGQLPT